MVGRYEKDQQRFFKRRNSCNQHLSTHKLYSDTCRSCKCNPYSILWNGRAGTFSSIGSIERARIYWKFGNDLFGSYSKCIVILCRTSDHSGASFGCRDWKQCRSDDVSNCKGSFVIKRAKTFKKAFRINSATKKRDGSTV